MLIPSLVPRKFGTRLIVMTLLAGLIPTVIFGLLLNIIGKRLTAEMSAAIAHGEQELLEGGEAVLRQMAESLIRQKTIDVALQLDLYLQAHPEKTLQDLQNDSRFREIGVQPVGETGYTAIQESNTAINRFHKNREIENMDLHTLADKLPDFWSIIQASSGGKCASGYYRWQESDGTIRDKFMYIAPLRDRTADGVPLDVAATTYIDEFTRPNIAAKATFQNTTLQLKGTVDDLILSSEKLGFGLMGLGIILVLVMAYWVGVYFSRAITQLRQTTRAVNQGNLDVALKPVMSGEVGELTRDFNEMVAQLAETTVSRERLEESENKLRTIVEHSTNLFYSHTPDHILTYMSPQTRDYFDCEPEEALIRWMEFATDNPKNREGYEHTQRAIDTGERQPPFELELRGKKGRRIWVEVNESPVVQEGRTVAIVGALMDITERKRAEEALRESEEKYRTIFQSGSQGFFLMTDVFLDCNEQVCRIWACSREDIIGHSPVAFSPLTQPDGRNSEEAARTYIEAARAGRPQRFYWQHWRKDGELIDCEITLDALNLGGQPLLLATLTDITDRKRAEEEMRESEHKYRVLFEAANDGIFLQGAEGFVDCNEKGASMYGLRREEVLGRSPAELSPERQLDGRLSSEVADEKMRAALKGEPQIFEWLSLHASGVPFQVEITLNRVEMGGTFLLQAIVRDITERKRAEQALRVSEGRFRLAWDTSPDALSISNLKDGTYVDVNNGFTFLTGYPRDEIVGSSALDIPLWADPRDRETFVTALAHHGHIRNFETKLLRKDGETRTILMSAGLMKLGGDQHLLSVAKDIEDIKRAEEAVRASEEKYRKVVENAHDAIFIAQDGFIKFPNPQLAIISGYSLEELTRKPFLEFVHPDDRELVATTHQRRMQGENVPNTYSFRAVNKSGDSLWVELSGVFLTWEGSPASLNFLRDITLQKKLESQLVHAHKMEAVGTLAGGIAHDFNNLLQAVQGYAELLLLPKEEGDPGYKELQEISRAAKRGGELTRQLLTFSRKVESILQPVDLNRIVEDVRLLLERTIPKMIKIELHLTGNLHHVNADASQVEQTLMNLAVNARDAMPEGGTLSIETKNVFLDENHRRRQPELPPGKYVLLAVKDTGYGMDKATLENIFDPFFTTKEVGKGTGLGLAMVYGIVKNHHGHISCFSKRGEGTKFEIYLPAVEHSERAATVIIGTEASRGGNETVLIADDDDSLRDLGERILQTYGYTVMSAPDGEIALQVYQKYRDRINLVILDLIMPGMGGAVCLQKLLEINPEAKVVIASGYSASGESEKAAEGGAKAFIKKPYDVREMLRVVREVIDE